MLSAAERNRASSELLTEFFPSVVQRSCNVAKAYGTANRHGVGICIEEHRIEMTEVALDPVLDSNRTCRVTVPTSCAEEGYVVTISIFDLCARLLATRMGRLMQMGFYVSGIDERF